MTSQLEYGTISTPEDAQQLGVIVSQCFNDQSPNGWQTYSNRIGLENFRVIRQARQIIGGLSIYQMGQWYGGECVPMAGIASVGVAPEHRGTGAAFGLLTQTLKELYASRVPLSTLYAATQRPYRKVGYEQGGSLCSWEIPTDSIQLDCFWSFLAAHRSIVKKVRWRSSAIDPLMMLLSEQSAKIHRKEHWMLRIIDVSTALEKRGYPLGVETKLHLEVRDNLLPENHGKIVLTVANGRGEVTKGGKGELQIDVRGLAPLYTGLFTPLQLQLTGQMEATQTAMLSATQIFAGSQPWMSDFF